jgi:hypothetical protein
MAKYEMAAVMVMMVVMTWKRRFCYKGVSELYDGRFANIPLGLSTTWQQMQPMR